MKKIKSPWYELIWILVWTAALLWFVTSGIFESRELIGLLLVWAVLVAVCVYSIVRHYRSRARAVAASRSKVSAPPALNAPCPCGSGK
jgi:TRAP-type C4-dicarboxylate transport system permease large subunit